MKKSLAAILLSVALFATVVIGASAQIPAAGSWYGVYGATVTDTSAGTNIAFADAVYAMRAGYTKQINLDGFRMHLSNITADAGVKIPMSIGSMTGDQIPYTWTDKACMTIIFDLSATTGAVIVQANNLPDLASDTIYGDVAEAIGTDLYIAFDKTATAWQLTVNGNVISIPNTFMSGCVPDTTLATMALGGDWNWGTGDKNVSYTISHMSTYAPYSVDIGNANIKASDIEDHWGTGTGIAETANGVKITADAFGKRANTAFATAVDGMVIKLTDVSYDAITTASDGATIAFTITKDLGGFTNGGNGVFFRINQTSSGQVFLNVALAKDNCDNEASRIIDNLELGGSFTRGLPGSIEIRFAKDGSNYDVYLNDQEITLDAAAVEGQIFENNTAYVSFGGWTTVPGSYTVNYIYSANTPTTAPTTAITTAANTTAANTTAANTTDVTAPKTSDSMSMVTILALLAVICISAGVLVFTRKEFSK